MCPFKTLTYQYFRTWNLQNFPFQQLPTCCPDWQHRVQEHYFCRGLLSTLQQGCHQMHHRVTRTLPETTLHTYMRIGRQEKQARTASSPQPQPRRIHLCCIQRGQQRGTRETPTCSWADRLQSKAYCSQPCFKGRKITGSDFRSGMRSNVVDVLPDRKEEEKTNPAGRSWSIATKCLSLLCIIISWPTANATLGLAQELCLCSSPSQFWFFYSRRVSLFFLFFFF